MPRREKLEPSDREGKSDSLQSSRSSQGKSSGLPHQKGAKEGAKARKKRGRPPKEVNAKAGEDQGGDESKAAGGDQKVGEGEGVESKKGDAGADDNGGRVTDGLSPAGCAVKGEEQEAEGSSLAGKQGLKSDGERAGGGMDTAGEGGAAADGREREGEEHEQRDSVGRGNGDAAMGEGQEETDKAGFMALLRSGDEGGEGRGMESDGEGDSDGGDGGDGGDNGDNGGGGCANSGGGGGGGGSAAGWPAGDGADAAMRGAVKVVDAHDDGMDADADAVLSALLNVANQVRETGGKVGRLR